MPADGQPLDSEEVLLDGNVLAEGSNFFSIGTYSVSPDDRLLAYSTDFSGDERYTMRVKDLVTGEVLSDEIPNTFYGCAWSLDATPLFYVTVDEAWRPYRVWRARPPPPRGPGLLGMGASPESAVVSSRGEGRPGRRVLPGTATAGDSASQHEASQHEAGQHEAREIAFPEPIYTVGPGANPELA